MLRKILILFALLFSLSLHAQTTYSVQLGKVLDQEELPSKYYTSLRELHVSTLMINKCSDFEYCVWSGLYQRKKFAVTKLDEYKKFFPEARVRQLDRKSILKIIEVTDYGNTVYENETGKPHQSLTPKSTTDAKVVPSIDLNKSAIPFYTFQIMSVGRYGVPNEVKEKLKKLGFKSYFLFKRKNMRILYAGRYKGVSAANSYLNEINKQFKQAFVIRWPEKSVEVSVKSGKVIKLWANEVSKKEQANRPLASSVKSHKSIKSDVPTKITANVPYYTFKIANLGRKRVPVDKIRKLRALGFKSYFLMKYNKERVLYAGRYKGKGAARKEQHKVLKLFHDALIKEWPAASVEVSTQTGKVLKLWAEEKSHTPPLSAAKNDIVLTQEKRKQPLRREPSVKTVKTEKTEQAKSSKTVPKESSQVPFYTYEIMNLGRSGVPKKVVSRLKALGFQSYFLMKYGKERKLYAGRYKGYSAARKDQYRIKRTFKHAYVLKWPSDAVEVSTQTGKVVKLWAEESKVKEAAKVEQQRSNYVVERPKTVIASDYPLIRSNKEVPPLSKERDTISEIPYYTFEVINLKRGGVPKRVLKKLRALGYKTYFLMKYGKERRLYAGRYKGVRAARKQQGRVLKQFKHAFITEWPEASVEVSLNSGKVVRLWSEVNQKSITKPAVKEKEKAVSEVPNYTYQIMSVASESVPNRIKEKLTGLGFDSYYLYTRKKHTTLYAGHYKGYSRAKTMLHTMNKTFKNAFIIQLPSQAEEITLHSVEQQAPKKKTSYHLSEKKSQQKKGLPVAVATKEPDAEVHDGTIEVIDSTLSHYTFHLASIGNRSVSSSQLRKIRSMGFVNYFLYHKNGSTTLYVGKYSGYAKAEQELKTIKRHFKDAYIIELPKNAEVVEVLHH